MWIKTELGEVVNTAFFKRIFVSYFQGSSILLALDDKGAEIKLSHRYISEKSVYDYKEKIEKAIGVVYLD